MARRRNAARREKTRRAGNESMIQDTISANPHRMLKTDADMC